MKQDIRAFYKPKFRGKRFPSFHSGSLSSVMLRKSYSCIVFGIPTRVLLHDWIS